MSGFLRTLSHGFRSPAGDITLPAPGVSNLRLEQDGGCALLVCRLVQGPQNCTEVLQVELGVFFTGSKTQGKTCTSHPLS